MKKKIKLATSFDIYSRIVWDTRINQKAFVIGYTDRVIESGIQEKSLLAWEPEGDIPWHRVQYFRCGKDKVWDREKRIDLFKTNQLPTIAWIQNTTTVTQPEVKIEQTQKDFITYPIYRHINGIWDITNDKISSVKTQLKISTLNTLSDRYFTAEVQTEKRIPAILKALEEEDADIIALQEVTPRFWKQLLKNDWIKDNFYVSESLSAERLRPDSVVLLSKYPFEQTVHKFSSMKRCIIAQFDGFSVVVVHLTSNRAKGATEKRSKQLQTIIQYLNTNHEDAFIIGDFNAEYENLEPVLSAQQFQDSWTAMHPNQSGITFDPTNNPLAKLISLTGAPKRLDYIWWCSKTGNWQATQANLFANQAIETTLFPSDHYGLSVSFRQKQTKIMLDTATIQKIQTATPTYHSAIVLIPPKDKWKAIQKLRKKHDRSYKRWMPHFTLIYGFIPQELFGQAAMLVAEAMKQIEPFQVKLTGYKTFEHRSSITTWLEPHTDRVNALPELQAALQVLFPQCDEQSKKENGFTPHLTIGQFKKQADIKRLPAWKDLSFEAGSIALISRQGKEPFEVIYEVELGTGKIKGHQHTLEAQVNTWIPTASAETQQQKKEALQYIEAACEEVLGIAVQPSVIGSQRLGILTKEADLDVVVPIPLNKDKTAFFKELQASLDGIYQDTRIVAEAQVPLLKLEIQGLAIDILAANYADFPNSLESLDNNDKNYMDIASWQACLGVLEADHILKTAQEKHDLATFRQYICAVRAWAKARGIHGNAWGYLGNFSWTTAATYFAQQAPKDAAWVDLFIHFFQTMYNWDKTNAIALSEAGLAIELQGRKDRIPVATAFHPCINSARNVTASTAQVIDNELERAYKLTKKTPLTSKVWTNLFQSYQEDSNGLPALGLTVKGINEHNTKTATGWIEGHFRAFLIDLEQQTNGLVQPIPTWEGNQTEAYTSLAILDGGTEGVTAWMEACESFVEQFNTWKAEEGIDVVLTIQPC